MSIQVGQKFSLDNKPNRKEHSEAVIYKITNKVNGKIYVGSAKNIWRRYKNYRYAGRHIGRAIRSAILKYGFHNFEFEILELVDNIENILHIEQYYLDTIQPYDPKGYNISKFATSWLGNKHSEETKKKISLINRGRVKTDDQKQKLSIINLNRDPEIQRQMTASIRNSWKNGTRKPKPSNPIVQIDMDTLQPLNFFPSIAIAASTINGNPSEIWAAIVGNGHSAHGFYWAYQKTYNERGFVKPIDKRTTR